MDSDHILAGFASPFEDSAYSAPSGELLMRLDLQAAAHALLQMAPLAGALASGIAVLVLMLGLSSLASLADRRGRQRLTARSGGPATGAVIWLRRSSN